MRNTAKLVEENLPQPKPEAEESPKAGEVQIFYPEMGGEQKYKGILRRSYNGGYKLKTPLELPKTRGLKHERRLKAQYLTPQAQKFAGWNQYTLTENGLKLLNQKGYSFSLEILLD